MKQFVLREEPDGGGFIRLRGDDYHYLVKVRRLRPGMIFKVLVPGPESGVSDLPGRQLNVMVRSIDNSILVGSVSETAVHPEAGPPAGAGLPPIILFQALPKGARMDLIVRQAAEGALSEVVPFVSEYSVPREKSAASEERWRRIVKEACQQSGSPVDTRIRPVLSIDGALAYWEELRAADGGAAALLLHEAPLSQIARGPLEQGTFHRYLNTDPALVVLAAGPEGGFSAGEVRRFLDADFKPLHMGETVLRSETAALYGTAAVRIILLERASWMLKQ
jgi:16S rRNA (uracil1498-N3)-methyltransferase